MRFCIETFFNSYFTYSCWPIRKALHFPEHNLIFGECFDCFNHDDSELNRLLHKLSKFTRAPGISNSSNKLHAYNVECIQCETVFKFRLTVTKNKKLREIIFVDTRKIVKNVV